MNDTNPTRRTDELPARDGAPLAGWPTVITAEEAVALRGALGRLQTALDAVVRDRDEARVEGLRAALKIAAVYVMSCYHEWHVTRDRAEALRDLTKIREVLNDERAGELEAKT